MSFSKRFMSKSPFAFNAALKEAAAKGKLDDNPNFNIGARGITSAGYAARARSQFIYSKYLGGKMIELFENVNQRKANDMVISMVLYAGSRTNRSSPHWKAADISSF